MRTRTACSAPTTHSPGKLNNDNCLAHREVVALLRDEPISYLGRKDITVHEKSYKRNSSSWNHICCGVIADTTLNAVKNAEKYTLMCELSPRHLVTDTKVLHHAPPPNLSSLSYPSHSLSQHTRTLFLSLSLFRTTPTKTNFFFQKATVLTQTEIATKTFKRNRNRKAQRANEK